MGGENLGMVSEMAFERKWVSESNLDKLWSETIEKKEANKQRRSPDFCKQAVLSATLKRISSEMIMRRLSEPMIEFSPEDVISSVSMRVDEEYLQLDDSMSCDQKPCTELLTPDNVIASQLNGIEESDFEKKEREIIIFSSIESHSTVTEHESPKRKRSDLDDDKDENNSCSTSQNLQDACSPAKRQRYRSGKHHRSMSPRSNRRRSQSAARRTNSSENISISTDIQQCVPLPKIKVVNYDETTTIRKRGRLNSASPMKSVVSSISSLSLENERGSWHMPVNDHVHKDPLELDGFFKQLKEVTS